MRAKHADIKVAFFSDAPKVYALLAEIDGVVVGMATYCENYSTFFGQPGIWLDDVYVLPEYRNQGIGKALLACLCAVGLERGCTRIDSTIPTDLSDERRLSHVVGARVFDELRPIRIDTENMKKLAHNAENIPFDQH